MKLTISNKENAVLRAFLEKDIARMRVGLTKEQCPEKLKHFILGLINSHTILLEKLRKT